MSFRVSQDKALIAKMLSLEQIKLFAGISQVVQ